MNEADNDLKEALADNGSFDPEKAGKLKKKAAGAFSGRMRKVERLYWISLILCVCLGLFAYLRFQSPSTTSTKALIGYAVLLLIAYESTVLIKLWYWVVNNKLSVLKEIKQLRLEGAFAAGRDAPRDRELEQPLRSISWLERIAWLVGVIIIVELAVEYATPAVYRAIVGHKRRPSLSHEGYVTLAPDGSGTTVTKTFDVNRGVVPLTSGLFEMPSGSTVRWIDDRGRELPVTVSTEDGRSRYTVGFIDPVMPGQPFTYKRVTENPALAEEKDDLWTYQTDWSFGPQSYQYTETVVLPKGADVVSAAPEPVKQSVWDGKPVLCFEARCDEGEHFRYTIQYRLSPE